MSFRTLANRAVGLQPAILGGSQAMARRAIASTPSLYHKESTSQNPDEPVDKHKLDSLRKQTEGKGHWKPELASDSEEAVKADRSGPQESAGEAMKRLQDRTKQAAEENAKAGTSMRDGL